MNVTTIGFDIAKAVIQMHRVDANGAVTLRRRLSRSGTLKFFASLKPCLVAGEPGQGHANLCRSSYNRLIRRPRPRRGNGAAI